MRHRIVLLKPITNATNSMNEIVLAYQAHKPGLDKLVISEQTKSTPIIWVEVLEDEESDPIIVPKLGQTFIQALNESLYANWANVKPMTGREYMESQKIRAETTYNVSFRYIADVTADMLVLYNGKKLKIESALNLNERNRQILLVCSEVI